MDITQIRNTLKSRKMDTTGQKMALKQLRERRKTVNGASSVLRELGINLSRDAETVLAGKSAAMYGQITLAEKTLKETSRNNAKLTIALSVLDSL